MGVEDTERRIGHPSIARHPEAPEGDEGDKTVEARIARKLHRDKKGSFWIMNNKAGRFCGEQSSNPSAGKGSESALKLH